MDISVIGLGKLGLSMAVAIASRGHRVIGVDIVEERVTAINEGRSPVNEPAVEELLGGVLKDHRLQCTTDYREAVAASQISFVAVNTPDGADGTMDLGQVADAARRLGEALRDKGDYHLVAVNSTVLPGTVDELVKPLLEQHSGKRPGVDFSVCSNPVFIALTTVVPDYLSPPFVVIGASDPRAQNILVEFYAGLCHDHPPIFITTPLMAELIKFAHNAYATFKMAFINEMMNLCARTPGADVAMLSQFFRSVGERGGKFLRPGLGFGGPCFPRDLSFFISYARGKGVKPILLEGIQRSNQASAQELVLLIKEKVSTLAGRRVAVLGLAYKPGVDIIENSMALQVVKGLQAQGAVVVAYDPLALKAAREKLGGGVRFAPSARECLAGADLCLIATPWEEFKALTAEDFQGMRSSMVFDPWGIYPEEIAQGVQAYYRIGKS